MVQGHRVQKREGQRRKAARERDGRHQEGDPEYLRGVPGEIARLLFRPRAREKAPQRQGPVHLAIMPHHSSHQMRKSD